MVYQRVSEHLIRQIWRDDDSADDVTIKLSRAKALALFEWAQRFMEINNPAFKHPADAIAVDSIASELEWALPEVFTAGYPELLRAGRECVVAEYRSHMVPQHSVWFDKLKYQDVDLVDSHLTTRSC